MGKRPLEGQGRGQGRGWGDVGANAPNLRQALACLCLDSVPPTVTQAAVLCGVCRECSREEAHARAPRVLHNLAPPVPRGQTPAQSGSWGWGRLGAWLGSHLPAATAFAQWKLQMRWHLAQAPGAPLGAPPRDTFPCRPPCMHLGVTHQRHGQLDLTAMLGGISSHFKAANHAPAAPLPAKTQVTPCRSFSEVSANLAVPVPFMSQSICNECCSTLYWAPCELLTLPYFWPRSGPSPDRVDLGDINPTLSFGSGPPARGSQAAHRALPAAHSPRCCRQASPHTVHSWAFQDPC